MTPLAAGTSAHADAHRPPRRGKRTVSRVAVPLLALSVSAGLVTSSCSVLGKDDGSQTLDAFVEALSSENVADAAAQTTDPDAASAALQASLDGLSDEGANPPDLTATYQRSDDGPAALDLQWALAPGADGAARTFSGTGQAQLTKVDKHWKVQWDPRVLDSRLTPGAHFSFSQVLDYSPRVLAADGSPLMEWIPVTRVEIPRDPALPQVEQVAALVGQQHPEITADSIRSGMAQGEQQGPYTVVTLREDDIAPVRAALAALPQVTLAADHRLVNSGFASPALSSVQPAMEKKMATKAGWQVVIAGGDVTTQGAQPGGQHADQVAGAPAGRIDDVTTTLDPGIQKAAQSAVDGTGLAASIVAIRPSTGEVVSVAQNSAANRFGPVALMGQFPPGSTFKSVTTAAALAAGTVGPDDTVQCPAKVTVSGRTIPNDEDFALGPVPLRTAFARSCNTSQAIISEDLPPEAMRDTAASLGLGVDFTVPGLDTTTGNVPVTEPGPARVEAAIGQGTVVASPFGLAELEASLTNGGRMVLPTFFRGEPGTADQQPKPLDPGIVQTIESFQRQVVTSGTATGAAGVPDLRGKTGTAETGVGPAHGWFTGATGDLAFAVLIQEADSSKPAVAMAANFLQSRPG